MASTEPSGMTQPSHLHRRASDVIRRLRNIDKRLSAATTNVCGTCPEQTSGPQPIEEHLLDKFDSMSRLLSSIEDEVMRLENSVGTNAENIKGGAQMAHPKAVGY